DSGVPFTRPRKKRNFAPVDQDPYTQFCIFDDFADKFPPDFTQNTPPQFLAMCRRGNGPQYFKSVNERSAAMWRRPDIASWLRMRWGSLNPPVLEALIASGFPDPRKAKSSYPQPRRRRGNTQRKKAKV